MKNFYFTLATAFLIFGCEQAEPVLEMEKEMYTYDRKQELWVSEDQTQEIATVMPMDRELYEYSVKATGEPIEEVEKSFTWYEKEFGEEYPENMQLTFLFDAENAIIFRPPPIPCICRPPLIPNEITSSVNLDRTTFKIFAFDPSRVSVYLTNEKGEVLYASPEKMEGELNSNTYVRLKQVSEIRGEEFFITVNTNYLTEDKVVKKILTYSFSEKIF